MLQKSETSRWAVIKYGFATLLIASLFVFVAACEDQSKKDVVSNEPITISGQIVGANNIPIPGANIVLKGAQTGTSTDASGEYQFRVPANGTLVVSFAGHQSIEVPVNGQKALYVRLAQPTDGTPSIYWTGTPRMPKRSTTTHATDLLDREIVDDGKGEIFTVVEKHPEFPGGMPGLGAYIIKNLKYPEAAKRAYVSGKVFLSFVVNTDGSIQDVQILKGLGFGTDEEAIRMIKAMPRWKPAMQNGKLVRVKYNLPIKFELAESQKTTASSTAEDDGKMDPKFYAEVRQDYNRFVVNGKSVSFDEYVKQDRYAYEGSFDKKNKTVYISVKTPAKPY